MTISVKMIRSPEHSDEGIVNHAFSENGGTIGRAATNTWVLTDAERFMSSIHAQINVDEFGYQLTDLSTNGTFVNGSNLPIGYNQSVSLKTGDVFSIGDYEFEVSLDGEQVSPMPSHEDFDSADPFAFSSPSLSDSDDINNYARVPNSDDLISDPKVTNDPLVALERAGESDQPMATSLFGSAPAIEAIDYTGAGSNAVSDAVEWPAATIESGVIPDDWDLDDDDDLSMSSEGSLAVPFSTSKAAAPISTSATSSVTEHNNELLTLQQKNNELSLVNQAQTAEIKKLRQEVLQLKSQGIPEKIDSKEGDQLIKAMGLDHCSMTPQKRERIVADVGVIVRETLAGMMKVLKFRKQIKEEFRINVTTIQSVENNPLKFSANVDDALENMFIKENNAYKAPIEAIKEGFDGIGEHQIAVIAGMQAAFGGMLEKFSPQILERRFEKYGQSGVMSFGQHKKRWQSYEQYHKELLENLDDSFQQLFGYEFVKAYEEHMQKLFATNAYRVKEK